MSDKYLTIDTNEKFKIKKFQTCQLSFIGAIFIFEDTNKGV